MMTRLYCAILPVAGLMLAAPPVQAVSPQPVEAASGMVVSAQHLATEAGLQILRNGGNAVDAAVATGYAQAVTNPCCANIGGGGFMLIHLASGREVFVNFRETAPAAARPTMYLDPSGAPIPRASVDGYRAVAVPGTVLGLDEALRRYGTLSRARVMAPAIRLARDGFVLTQADTAILNAAADRLRRDPEARRIFFHVDGSALRPGERLRQPQLARTLEIIAAGGPDAFYHGEIARQLAAAMRANAGLITQADLAAFTVGESSPLYCTYRGYRIASAPPPSSGGATLCEILNVLEGYDLNSLGYHSAATIHYLAEAMRHAYVDRNTYLGDPAFVRNPLTRLLSTAYAAQIRSVIDPVRATSSLALAPGAGPHEKPETTHYCVVDATGNAVSVTYTLNGSFGAGVIAPGTGFLLNDEMDDFTIKPGVPNSFGLVQGEANAIAPGKRPLSSMAPTIVTRDGRVALVIGSPGGSRIITSILQVLLNLIDFGMQPQEAVDAPRIHEQWLPDEVYAEPFALSSDTVQLLQSRGYRITVQPPWGAVELIALPRAAALRGTTADSLALEGANDDRRPAGEALGY